MESLLLKYRQNEYLDALLYLLNTSAKQTDILVSSRLSFLENIYRQQSPRPFPHAHSHSQPPTREVSDELFEAADSDKSGTINKEEFEKILLILGAQIVSRMVVYYTVLILFVPWFAPKTTDHFDSIPKGGFVESVAHQVISIAIFVLAIPSIWDAIDSTTKGTIHWVNSENKTDSNPKQEADKKDD